MPTLLEYLTSPNLDVDRTSLQPGTNTLPIGTYEIEDVQPWNDFTLEKILECYGDILLRDFPDEDLYYPPPIRNQHLHLTSESSVDFIYKKHNHTIVDRALELAEPLLEGRGLRLPISMSCGSASQLLQDPRISPDWAGTVESGRPPYENRVPGDTKQSAKWRSTMKDSTLAGVQEEYGKPLRQLHLYAVRANTRYGYLVTDSEACFFRRTKSPEPPEPLSLNRPRRQPPQRHNRVTSLTSVVSGTSGMSLDSSGSPYTDAGNPDINEAPLETGIVPWGNHGMDRLSINLCLFFIHLLAASDISVEESYPTLGSWQKIRDAEGQRFYRQVGSHRATKTLPQGSILAEAASQS